jgi:hypothetical protein
MAKLKIINGGRRELEYQLLAAMFTPGGNANVETLRLRLARRGGGQIRAVGATPAPGSPPRTLEPVDDRT